MAGKLVAALNAALFKFEDAIVSAILRRMQPGLCLNGCSGDVEKPKSKFSLKDIWGEGFVWGVPKHRRSLEKRLNRKFGFPKYNWKPLVPKTNLLMCNSCGHFHESDTICGHCYEKVRQETQEIQKAISDELKLDPVKDEIVVLYEGEKDSKPKEYWKGQRIVEMPKQRPTWFQHNLLESSTQTLSDSKEVKPNDLA